MSSNVYSDQVSGGLVNAGVQHAENLKDAALREIVQKASEREEYAHAALSEGLKHVENVRDFVSKPDAILGNTATKHGEIAEYVEVEIRNARNILRHTKPKASFDGVGRTAPEDYKLDGINVQSKYINGTGKTLDHVICHLHKYPGFTENGYYHIPKDQYSVLEKIYNGENVPELSSRSLKKCQEAIRQIENETGKPFPEVVKPGLSSYNEVQIGKIDQTLDNHEKELNTIHDKEIKEIRNDRRTQEKQAQHITDASWGEALKYSAFSAVIAGTTSAGIKIFSKIRDGKKLSQSTLDDWKDVGYDFTKSSAKGGISGLSIYGLTKVAHVSAPLASAIVSTAMGVSSLYIDYKKGKISKSEYGDAACALSVEAGLAALGSAIGQVVIPVPVLGAIVGAAVSKSVIEISKYVMGNKEKALIAELQSKYKAFVDKLDTQCQEIISSIENYYTNLKGLIRAAFDPDINKRLNGSIELCRFVGIPDKIIIHNVDETDVYMRN